MKQRFLDWWNEWWNALTFWAIARRQEWRNEAHGDDVVVAIMLRRAHEKGKLTDTPRER